jgi:acyl-CoA dehydrogenase
LEVAAEHGGIAESTAVEIGQLVERVEAARAMAYNTAQVMSRGEGFPPHMPSVLKLYGSTVSRRLVEVATEVLGLEVADYHLPDRRWDFWNEFMFDIPHTIAGGSNEIQHDIIATRHFGIAR